uniref:Uncharacterized protein n=1 Tax=Anguilla anguilla TaxID=7936 RepID=A0A0E9TK40_ANGAN
MRTHSFLNFHPLFIISLPLLSYPSTEIVDGLWGKSSPP